MFVAFNLGKYKGKILAVLAVAAVCGLGVCAFNYLYPLKYTEHIKEYSSIYGLDPVLVCAVINAESGFNKDAVSIKGASGLMQIMEPTANWHAEEIGLSGFNYQDDIFDPEKNIMIGCWYLGVLKKQYGGDLELVLAAYNAGSGNVSKWLKDSRYSKDGATLEVVPYKETSDYIERVTQNMKVYKWLIQI